MLFFAVGENDALLHYNGSNWSLMESGVPGTLSHYAVWGSSGSDVYAWGQLPLHFDGVAWSYQNPVRRFSCFGIWGSSSTNVFAVGRKFVDEDFFGPPDYPYRGAIHHCFIDVDNDGSSDEEDNCPDISNHDQTDIDEDGVGDVCDNCPETPNGPEGGTCKKSVVRNLCMSDDDCGTNGLCSMNQEDVDGDNIGDVCDLCPSEKVFGEYSEKTEFLRNFRDEVLSQTPEGQEIIKLYYHWGPTIVRTMEEDEEFREEVKELIDGVLGLITETE